MEGKQWDAEDFSGTAATLTGYSDSRHMSLHISPNLTDWAAAKGDSKF